MMAARHLTLLRLGGLSVAAALALLGQQSQFQGSVPTGTASTTPIPLTLRGAMDRGSESESRAAGQRLDQRDRARAAPPIAERVTAVRQRPGQPDRRTTQPGNDWASIFRFRECPFRLSLVRFITPTSARLRLGARSIIPRERTIRSAQETERAARLSAQDARDLVVQAVAAAYLQIIADSSRMRRDPFAGADRASAVRSRRRSASGRNFGRHRRSAIPGGTETAATTPASSGKPVRQGQAGAGPRHRVGAGPGLQHRRSRAIFAADVASARNRLYAMRLNSAPIIRATKPGFARRRRPSARPAASVIPPAP